LEQAARPETDHAHDLHPSHQRGVAFLRPGARHADYADASLEFGAGDNVRCKTTRLRGPGESTPRQQMIAVERIR
jgi:hypothetical protein